MKGFKFSVLRNIIMVLCLLTFCWCTSPAGIDSPEQFGKTIFEALKGNNLEKFTTFFPSMEDVKELLERRNIDENKKKQLLEGSNSEIKVFSERLTKSFKKIREIAVSEGVVWSNTEFVKTEYQIRQIRNFETADIYIVFFCSGLNYKIKLDDCIKAKRGWVLSDQVKWKKVTVYKNADWDGVHVFPIKAGTDLETIEGIVIELRKSPVIFDITIFSQIPHLNKKVCSLSSKESGENMEKEVNLLYIDHNFLKTVKIPLLMGRPFLKNFPADRTGAFIVNDKLCNLMNWKSPVGTEIMVTFSPGFVQKGRVIGVIANIMGDLTPATIHKMEWPGYGYIGIRTAKSQWSDVLEMIKSLDSENNVIEKFEPFPVEKDLRKQLSTYIKQ